MDAEAAATAILRLGVAKMAAAVHEISVARGFDPRDFALLSYGGAGPLHAALVAEEVGIPRVIVPPSPGAFSAFGALCSALSKDRSRTVLEPLATASLEAAESAFAAMLAELRAEFAAESADVSVFAEERQLDMRYRGQAHELTITVPCGAALPEVMERFEAAFERQFGRRDSGRGIEVVNLRVTGRIPIEAPAWTAPGGGAGRPSGTRLLPGLTTAVRRVGPCRHPAGNMHCWASRDRGNVGHDLAAHGLDIVARRDRANGIGSHPAQRAGCRSITGRPTAAS